MSLDESTIAEIVRRMDSKMEERNRKLNMDLEVSLLAQVDAKLEENKTDTLVEVRAQLDQFRSELDEFRRSAAAAPATPTFPTFAEAASGSCRQTCSHTQPLSGSS